MQAGCELKPAQASSDEESGTVRAADVADARPIHAGSLTTKACIDRVPCNLYSLPAKRLAFSWNGRMGAASHGCRAATASFTSSVLLVLGTESITVRLKQQFCEWLDMTCGGMQALCTAKPSSKTLLTFGLKHSSAVRADLPAAIAHDAEAAATLTA